MASYDFLTLDVFTDRPFTGNPLAVFPQADGIPDDLMPKIAAEFNLSETVFIRQARASEAVASLRIFTPKAELPFAGHPTIGATIVLAASLPPEAAQAGFLIETKAGLVQASAQTGPVGSARVRSPLLPSALPIEGSPNLAQAVNLDPDDIVQGAFAPAIFGVGVPFTFIAVKDRAALARAKVNPGLWDQVFDGSPAAKTYLFTMPDWSGSIIHARMFAPTLGVAEDPATGSAASALAGLLVRAQALGVGDHQWLVHQGEDMGRPSRISLSASIEPNGLSSVHIAGHAVKMLQGQFNC
jgi:trans-2,3-dihydro-3-hydroxyanthranilate isomerase